MGAVTKWSSVKINMQSAIDSAKIITDITQASPAVVTSTAHGYANGDLILLDVQGMNEVNGRGFRVANQSPNDFELEGLDATLFGAFSSGGSGAKKLTLGVSMSTVTGVSGSGGEFDFLDTTTIHDAIKTQIPGLPSPLAYTFENLWDVSDPALIAMKDASDNQAQRAFLFTFPSGQIMLFNGYVGASLVPGGSAQDKVTTSTTITAFGAPTYYAS